MKRFGLATVAAAIGLFAIAPAAQATTIYSVVFTGAAGQLTPIQDSDDTDNSLESLTHDILGQGGDDPDEGDSVTEQLLGSGFSDPVTDSDNGNGGLDPTSPGSFNAYNDGAYDFTTALSPLSDVQGNDLNPSLALVVDDNQAPAQNTSGVYLIDITSSGDYENILVGTGGVSSNDPEIGSGGSTSVTLRAPVGALGDVLDEVDERYGVQPNAAPGAITNASYEILFVGGNGLLTISDVEVENSSVAGAAGAGYVNIIPSKDPGALIGGLLDVPPNVPGVNEDVQRFEASGAFAAVLP